MVKLKSSRRKFCGRHHDKNPLWNVCVTDDNGYVLFVVWNVCVTEDNGYVLFVVWNVCVTDDNGYVLFVVVTVPCFVLHS